ncbi:hypothetical protein DPMN_174476 [Dreissena polymorpha]|uniref:Uncharacterized protein n=1 Tax=Dreissena polymorpha TaxID=45954 RepID=A0A9D4IHW6_DREPO|nr:hypothetical protein DPMN_174476 [Dreissena polymorpha]
MNAGSSKKTYSTCKTLTRPVSPLPALYKTLTVLFTESAAIVNRWIGYLVNFPLQ